ncbi:MAG TPA: hypothetical protein VHV55_05370 [Pirellulales bacterium]|nr:hypothetical protein [Pirellulales bacterium]
MANKLRRAHKLTSDVLERLRISCCFFQKRSKPSRLDSEPPTEEARQDWDERTRAYVREAKQALQALSHVTIEFDRVAEKNLVFWGLSDSNAHALAVNIALRFYQTMGYLTVVKGEPKNKVRRILPKPTSIEFGKLRAKINREYALASERRIQGRSRHADGQECKDNGTKQKAKPHWNRQSGKLLFNDRVVKTIRRLGIATNVVPVLDAFEELGWPERIDDPLPGGADSQRLQDTVKSLNSGLDQELHFRADGAGRGFVWEHLPGDSPVSPPSHP